MTIGRFKYFMQFSDRMDSGFGIFAVSLIILYVAILLFSLAFWVWMLCDCLFHNWRSGKQKLLWFLIILFGGVIGALLFFAIIKAKSKKE
jgi:hypothetical protein